MKLVTAEVLFYGAEVRLMIVGIVDASDPVDVSDGLDGYLVHTPVLLRRWRALRIERTALVTP